MKYINEKTTIHRLDPFLRKAIYQSFDGKCFYTGRDVPFEEMHIDHIIPLDVGGKDCIENYVLSCQQINQKKREFLYKDLIKIAIETNKALFCSKYCFRL
jgi:5-methylcytosine-specific restriction endonuclease McrA